MKRKFKRQIFLGCGEYSRKDIKILKKQLKKGLIILGSLQQSIEIHGDKKKDLEMVVRDIAMALLGKEIVGFVY